MSFFPGHCWTVSQVARSIRQTELLHTSVMELDLSVHLHVISARLACGAEVGYCLGPLLEA